MNFACTLPLCSSFTYLLARREALVAGSQQRTPGRETEATAELDNRGLVQLQQQVIQQQDQELEQMEKTVVSTKVGMRANCCCFGVVPTAMPSQLSVLRDQLHWGWQFHFGRWGVATMRRSAIASAVAWP